MNLARGIACVAVNLLAADIVCGQITAPTTPPRPNIVILLADDMGSGDVSWRGGPIATPHIDQLARSGTVFDQFYVMPLCSPTRAALLTGRYPFRYGLQVGVVRPWAPGLPIDERTLAEGMRDAGYETAIVGKWHLGCTAPNYLPTARGFEHQYGFYLGELDYYTHMRDGGYDWHRDDQRCNEAGYSTDLIGDEAIRLIKDRDKSRPLFLYVAFQAPHSPYQEPPTKYRQALAGIPPLRAIYLSIVIGVDEQVGRIMRALHDYGIENNTLVFFASDNGGPEPGRVTSNGQFRAGKGTVYEGGVHQLGCAAWPGVIKPGSTITQMTHIVDWYPTILTVASASLTQAKPLDGVDITPLLKGEDSPVHNELDINVALKGGAIRVGNWKLVVNGYRFGDDEDEDAKSVARRAKASGSNVYELFDLTSDPGEKHDLANEKRDIVRRLTKRFEELKRETAMPLNEAKPPNFHPPTVWGEFGSTVSTSQPAH